MKRILTTSLFVALVATPALAQNTDAARGGAAAGGAAGAVGGAIVGGPVGAVVGGIAGLAVGSTAGALTPEDHVYLRQYVRDRKDVQGFAIQDMAIGGSLPRTVALYRIEGNPRLSDYRYAYVNNQYLLVDANGRIIGAIQ